MAFRQASRVHIAPASVVLLFGASIAFPRRRAYADAPSGESLTRKPIYDSLNSPASTSDPTLPSSKSPEQNSPSEPAPPTLTDRLVPEVRRAREVVYTQFLAAEESVNRFLSAALAREASIANTIASLAPPPQSGEKVLPGLIYVLVSTMAGNIVTRNRGIFLRTAFPLTTGVVAGWMLIPHTMQNVGDLIWEGEQKIQPLAEGHLVVRGFVTEAIRQTKIHGKVARNWVDETAGDARKIIEGWVNGK